MATKINIAVQNSELLERDALIRTSNRQGHIEKVDQNKLRVDIEDKAKVGNSQVGDEDISGGRSRVFTEDEYGAWRKGYPGFYMATEHTIRSGLSNNKQLGIYVYDDEWADYIGTSFVQQLKGEVIKGGGPGGADSLKPITYSYTDQYGYSKNAQTLSFGYAISDNTEYKYLRSYESLVVSEDDIAYTEPSFAKKNTLVSRRYTWEGFVKLPPLSPSGDVGYDSGRVTVIMGVLNNAGDTETGVPPRFYYTYFEVGYSSYYRVYAEHATHYDTDAGTFSRRYDTDAPFYPGWPDGGSSTTDRSGWRHFAFCCDGATVSAFFDGYLLFRSSVGSGDPIDAYSLLTSIQSSGLCFLCLSENSGIQNGVVASPIEVSSFRFSKKVRYTGDYKPPTVINSMR